MKHSHPLILAIDTSCDDTSAAVTCGTTVLSNIVASQAQLHKPYGGVFPTIAKQAHRENIAPTINLAVKRAGVSEGAVEAIAVTQGPGLAPALEVGVEKAKQLATEWGVPLIPVNHIEGHVLSPLAQRLKKSRNQEVKNSRKIHFPILSVIVSGKHTEFVLIHEIGQYQRLGFTVDDAAGEALDKFGRMVDIGYPAGPLIEEFARLGDAKKYLFPLPMTTSGNANMSFSGLKTSARNLIEDLKTKHPLTKQDVFDLCASFQYAVFHAITYKLDKLLPKHQLFGIFLGGGVASNVKLRQMLRQTIQPFGLSLQVPYDKRLCSDNAAMIGVTAGLRWEKGERGLMGEEIRAVERVPRMGLNTN